MVGSLEIFNGWALLLGNGNERQDGAQRTMMVIVNEGCW